MSEFDELLHDVLQCDVIVEPPVGIEARLRSALSAELGIQAGGRSFWPEAFAAAMLIGVMGGLVVKHFSLAAPVQVARERGSLLTQHAPERVPETAPTATDGFRAHVRAVRVRSGPSLARHRVPPASIELEPLRIQHIEIASLTVRSLASQGVTR